MSGARDFNSTRCLLFDVFLVDNIFVNKCEECIVNCYVKIGSYSEVQDLLFLPYHDKLASLGIVAASSLVRNHDNKIPVRMKNVSDEDRVIYKNTKIGTVEYICKINLENNRMLYNTNDVNENLIEKIVLSSVDKNSVLTSWQKK